MEDKKINEYRPREIILMKLGETVLKGQNKRCFEDTLMHNIRMKLGSDNFKIYALQSTIYAEPKREVDLDEAVLKLGKVFGIVYIMKAAVCQKDEREIARTAIEYLGEELKNAGTFAVKCKRSDKSFRLTGPGLSGYVGAEILKAGLCRRVSLSEPDFRVELEVRDRAAYVHSAPIKGAGGLPVGTGGSAVSLLSGGIDSPVSSYMMARRGLKIIPLHFFSFPYTSELAREKVIRLAEIISEYTESMELLIVPFTKIQEAVKRETPDAFGTIITRRFMMRIAEKVAKMHRAGGIVTGENLGQVASQTLEAMAAIQEVMSMPLLQPLCGMDKSDIVEIARKIGSFETSILPYEDCCTVFTPKKPKTRPVLREVIEAESPLRELMDELIEEAAANIERVRL